MRSNILLRSILFVLFVACIAGCREEPATSVPPQSQPPESPRDLAVVQLDSSITIIAGLSWRAPADSSGITGYRIWWSERPFGKLDSVDVDGTMRRVTIAELRQRAVYTIEVAAMRGALVSPRTNVIWMSGSLLAPPSPPSNLMAASAGSTRVNLSWTAPLETAGVTYTLSWIGSADNDSGTIAGITNTFYPVSGLRQNLPYSFEVRSVRGKLSSNPISIYWAGAVRYTSDAYIPQLKLRLYESASLNRGALIIDPIKGGPTSISVATPSDKVQLGLYALTGGSAFVIGPACAIPEFLHAASFDQNVYISDSAYPVSSLDTWFSPVILNYYIPADGNRRTFTLPGTLGDTRGIGFYLRTGAPFERHYARIFIKNVGGRLLQGISPDRYVEVEISYQDIANYPYAKRVARPEVPAMFGSQRRR